MGADSHSGLLPDSPSLSPSSCAPHAREGGVGQGDRETLLPHRAAPAGLAGLGGGLSLRKQKLGALIGLTHHTTPKTLQNQTSPNDTEA